MQKLRALIRLLFLMLEVNICAIRIILFENHEITQFSYAVKKLKPKDKTKKAISYLEKLYRK